MVADDVFGLSVLYPTGEVHQVIEAFVTLGELRTSIVRKGSV